VDAHQRPKHQPSLRVAERIHGTLKTYVICLLEEENSRFCAYHHMRLIGSCVINRENAQTLLPKFDSLRRSAMTPSAIRFVATLFMAATLSNLPARAEIFAVFKSTDRGRSWGQSDAGLPERSRINAFGSVDETLFAGTDSGVFISTNEALSWRPATGSAMASGRIISLATLDGKVFAGTDGNGVLVSANRGQSWILDSRLPSPKVRCLLPHAGALYAGTDADGVWMTSDRGLTWTRLSQGLPVDEQVFAMSAVKGKLFAGLYSRGLYLWNEQERFWAKRADVTPLALTSVEGTLIAGHNPGGLHWSDDLGVSWSKGTSMGDAANSLSSALSEDASELPAEAPVWELASGDGSLLAGAAAGVYFSEDRGRSWTRARTGLPENAPGVAFLVKRRFALAGTRLAGKPTSPPGGGRRNP
jgi:hypothetical protein